MPRRLSMARGASGPARWARESLATPACVLLAACSTGGARLDVPECARPEATACTAARDRFQVLNYDIATPDRLVAASSRAIGDLNFELVRRDDAAGIVLGRYVGSAPTHKDQLDSRFHDALRDAASLPLLARIEVGAAPTAGGPVPVRLQLLLPAPDSRDGTAQMPLDRVKPYQIFFQQLSLELGGRVAPPEGDDRYKDEDKRPRKPAVLPGPASVPTGL